MRFIGFLSWGCPHHTGKGAPESSWPFLHCLINGLLQPERSGLFGVWNLPGRTANIPLSVKLSQFGAFAGQMH
jgi:hypothetical protein